MPAYAHIYNRGIEGRDVFSSQEDYETFLGYLKEYLCPPLSPSKLKKQFTVNGKTYHGLPHQPKNYYNKVELVAYSLHPNHFHLVLNELEKGMQTKFLRSLGTRYAMYYNKKYDRRGPLFEGPYKSANIKSVDLLPVLTRHIHSHAKDSSFSYSSENDYLAENKSGFVTQDVVLGQIGNYENYAKEGSNIEQEQNLLDQILFEENENISLDNKIVNTAENNFAEIEANRDLLERSLHKSVLPQNSSKLIRIPEFVAASLGIFVVLFTLGYRNVSSHSNNQALIAENIASTPTPIPSPPPEVASAIDENIENPEEQPTNIDDLIEEIEKKTFVEISTQEEYVNIRLKPSIDSEVVQKAYNSETFEYVETIDGWHYIKLQDGLAYVSAEFSNLLQTP